jgi:hypothetical protein
MMMMMIMMMMESADFVSLMKVECAKLQLSE